MAADNTSVQRALAETQENVSPGPFQPLYEHFDAVANRLSGLYRGAFLLNSALGVVAVFCALLGTALIRIEHSLLVGELAAIALVLLTVSRLSRNRWHYYSVDCRYLAEQFRVLVYICPLGLTAPRLRLPAHHFHSEVQKSWMEWFLRAVIRSLPMPSGVVTPAFLGEQYVQVAKNWIAGQVLYHQSNHGRLHRIDTRLHWAVWVSALIAAAACVLHLALDGLPDDGTRSHWLTILAAGLPAFSAACHAISMQGEFRRLARRSEAMERMLTQMCAKLEADQDAGSVTLSTLREQAQRAAEIMIEEVVDWQILYPATVAPA